MIMKPVWVTVAARPAVGFLVREVCAEMTVLFGLTAAAASGTGLVRLDEDGSAYAGRWLPAANEGGPDGELTKSSRTARPATPTHTPACSCWSSPGTRTVGQGVRVLSASGRRQLLAALGGLSAVPGDRPQWNVPTSLAASNGAAASRPPQPQGRTSGS